MGIRGHLIFTLNVGLWIASVKNWPCRDPIGAAFAEPNTTATLYFDVKSLVQNVERRTLQVQFYTGVLLANIIYRSVTDPIVDVISGVTLTADSAGNVNLTLQPERAAAGTYRIYYATFGTECTCLYILGVPSKPSVIVNEIPSVGSTAILSCTSISTTSPSNHSLILRSSWFVNSSNILQNSKHTIMGKQLIIKNVIKEDAANAFTCSTTEDITGGYSSLLSEPLRFDVYYGPDTACTNVSLVQVFTEGKDELILRCFSDCFPGCSYTWTNASGVLSTTEELSIGTVKRFHAGNYTFSSRNISPGYRRSQERTFHVIVRYAPVVTARFSSSDLSKGSALTIFCDGQGVPAFYSYTGLTQTVGDVVVPNKNTAPEGTETYSSLHFPSLQLHDTGNYTCKMNNGIRDLTGKLDQSDSVELMVKSQPKILKDDLIYTGATGGIVTVQVPFYCYPAVHWVKFVKYDGTLMVDSAKIIILLITSAVYDTFYGKRVRLTGYEVRMIINNLQEEDFGNYSLTIKNDQGMSSVVVLVIPESSPSTPKYFAYTASAAGPAFIWEKGFNGGHTQTFVIEITVANSEDWKTLTSITESDEMYKINDTFYSANIKGLKPGLYTARLIATNVIGKAEPLSLTSPFTVDSVKSDENMRDSSHSYKPYVAGGLSAGAAGFIAIVVVVILFRRGIFQRGNRKDTEDASNAETTPYDVLGNTRGETEYSQLQMYESNAGTATYEGLQGLDERNREQYYERFRTVTVVHVDSTTPV